MANWSQTKSMPSFRRDGPAFSFASVLRSLFCLCWFSGLVAQLCAGDDRTVRDEAQLANVASRPIRLPIVAATDNQFVRLSTAQGLSQIKVDSILQDDQDFMWFGTRWGVYRYDGSVAKFRSAELVG